MMKVSEFGEARLFCPLRVLMQESERRDDETWVYVAMRGCGSGRGWCARRGLGVTWATEEENKRRSD